MIESHPLISLPSIKFEVPKCPQRPRRMQFPQSISPTLVKQALECFTTGWLHKSVLIQRSRRVNILRGGHHVVVACQDGTYTGFD